MFLSQGSIATSTIMNENKPVNITKQETIGIIFNWGIFIKHPLYPQNITWQYNVTYLI